MKTQYFERYIFFTESVLRRKRNEGDTFSVRLTLKGPISKQNKHIQCQIEWHAKNSYP